MSNDLHISDYWKKPLANGYGFFCPDCQLFFSVESTITTWRVRTCPYCSTDEIIRNQQELISWCLTENIDPTEFIYALDGTELIPHSLRALTPEQIRKVIRVITSIRIRDGEVTMEEVMKETSLDRQIIIDSVVVAFPNDNEVFK